jgi:hypothetical protein
MKVMNYIKGLLTIVFAAGGAVVLRLAIKGVGVEGLYPNPYLLVGGSLCIVAACWFLVSLLEKKQLA